MVFGAAPKGMFETDLPPIPVHTSRLIAPATVLPVIEEQSAGVRSV